MYELKQEFVDGLVRKAKLRVLGEEDDFNPWEASGGNYDDAYYIGMDDGETQAARTVLRHIGVDFNKKDDEDVRG